VPLTHDYVHHYRGLWTDADGGVCRVRVYEALGAAPVILVTELPENTNTSVTNCAEYLAAEVIARHFPARFGHEEPAVWVEHSPPDAPGWYRRRAGGGSGFDRVTFSSWAPRQVVERGVARVKLGEPSWSPLSVAELAALIGEDAVAGL